MPLEAIERIEIETEPDFLRGRAVVFFFESPVGGSAHRVTNLQEDRIENYLRPALRDRTDMHSVKGDCVGFGGCEIWTAND